MSKKNKSTSIATENPLPGIVCKSSLVVADIIIIWMEDGDCKVFKKENIEKKAELYKIDGASIEDVFVPYNHELLILKTKKGEYIRDFNNEEVEEAAHWADYYFEPMTASFYRKDTRGNWYDIEGYRLASPVFLKEDVLCSLPGKTSKKSASFKGQKLVISPSAEIIQIGKLVYNTDLKLVHYFGEKITGLGKKNISFSGKDILQEVLLGLNRSAFINEFTKEPYLINNEEIIGHVQTVVKGRHRFEVFKSNKRKYIVENASFSIFAFEGAPVILDFSTFLELGFHELIQAKKGRERFYMDINSKKPFAIPNSEEWVIEIDQQAITIGGDDLYNMKTKEKAFVYNENKNIIFTLNKGTVQPESITPLEGFENNYAFANIKNEQKLFYKKQNEIITLGEEELTIKTLQRKAKQKLFNAVSNSDEKIVLDARKGLDNLILAKSGDQKILKVLDQPHPVGNTVLQNVLLQTLGGSEPRVINLNEEFLSVFTLPQDLKEYPERETPSSFHGNPILSIDFENSIKIKDEIFYQGTFLSFFGNVHSVIIQQINARPLHLDGAGHRNELVTAFNLSTLHQVYQLGPHHMIGGHTLTEDFKENELLFSIGTKKSWLSFYDAFLPILKRVVELKEATKWNYLLFELREMSSTIEYIAVEKVPPYRVLVEKQKGKPVPKIVKSKEKVLKTPDEISAIQKFFLEDPGYLMEVD